MKALQLFVLFFLIATGAQAQTQYSVQNIFPNLPALSLPLEFLVPPDGTNRIFIVQQRGIIYSFENSPTANTRKTFLNISDKVSQSGNETGLLGCAFHPNYKNNGYFYVNYTGVVGGQLTSFIARYQVSAANPDSAIKASEQILLTVNQPYSNHNGGNLLFGSDGYLYCAFGDGGSGGDPNNNAQNRSVLLGKILRIDVNGTQGGRNYAIPPTNPFKGNTQGFREEIFSYGMRNPWKLSFDAETGNLWCGDVGQNAYEEIDIIRNGGNYGWRIMEGFACYNPSTGCDTTGLIKPLWTYGRSQGDISITGGYVYRGSKIPSLVGKYVYADYATGRIWALTYDGKNPATNQLLVDRRQPSAILISSFGEDQNKDIYIISQSEGKLYRLTATTTAVQDAAPATTLELEQNYPNPFAKSTAIRYRLSAAAFVTLKIFDLPGKEIATVVNDHIQQGYHSVTWDASSLPNGIYMYQLRAGNIIRSRLMSIVK